MAEQKKKGLNSLLEFFLIVIGIIIGGILYSKVPVFTNWINANLIGCWILDGVLALTSYLLFFYNAQDRERKFGFNDGFRLLAILLLGAMLKTF